MHGATRPVAIMWDYDGTLVDTRRKNLNVTKRIVPAVSGKHAADFPTLQSVEEYHAATVRATNWRTFYQTEFGFTESQVDDAGAMWSELQREDDTDVPFFPGVAETIRALAHSHHGIVSQNSSEIISRRLGEMPRPLRFDCIVGFQEVDPRRQKPDPEGLLLCAERLAGNLESGYAFYIGDHEADALCAANANEALESANSRFRFISIAACYGVGTDAASWDVKPDFTAHQAADIVSIVRKRLDRTITRG